MIHLKKAPFVDHWTRLWDFKSTKNVWKMLLSMVVNSYMEERESKEKVILLNQQLSRRTKRLNSSKKSISVQSCLLWNSPHSNKLLKSTIMLVKGWAAVYSLKTSVTLTSGLVPWVQTVVLSMLTSVLQELRSEEPSVERRKPEEEESQVPIHGSNTWEDQPAQ